MFSASVIESGDFLDLDSSVQILYIHLCMNADDDGVVDNAKRICKMIDSKPTNLQKLIDAEYVLEITEKLHLIKDFHINNYIRCDRYKRSRYFDILKDKFPQYIKERKIDKKIIEVVSTTITKESEEQ